MSSGKDFTPQELLLFHLGDCKHTATTIARVLAGPRGNDHARTLIGALLTTEATLSNVDIEDSAQCRADLARLYAELTLVHSNEPAFDA